MYLWSYPTHRQGAGQRSMVTDGKVTVLFSKPPGQSGPSTSLTNAGFCVVQSSVLFAQPLASHNTKEVQD